jgi:hypothetical protein
MMIRGTTRLYSLPVVCLLLAALGQTQSPRAFELQSLSLAFPEVLGLGRS